MKMFELKFLFLEKTILIRTNNRKIHQMLSVCFPEFISKKKADLTLEYLFYGENFDSTIYILKNAWRSDEKVNLSSKNKNLFIFKHKKGKKGKKLISGFLDLNKKQGKMKIRTNKSFFWGFFAFNLAKCLAIYVNEQKGSVIHSSAIAENKHAFLFSGKNDSGKTTISRICPEAKEIGEDMNFLFKKGKKFFVQSFPLITILTNIDENKTKAFKLKAVFFLNKSNKLKLKKLTKTEAMANLLRNDIQGTFNFQKIKTKERISLYEELFSSVPAFLLFFPLKKNLWKKIKAKLKKEIK